VVDSEQRVVSLVSLIMVDVSSGSCAEMELDE